MTIAGIWITVSLLVALVGIVYSTRVEKKERAEMMEWEARTKKAIEEKLKEEDRPRREEEDRRLMENALLILNSYGRFGKPPRT